MENLASGQYAGAVAVAALAGYLLGSIPFGLVITKLAGLGDIRSIGSGNIGATNVLRTGRRDLALATLLLDAGKAGLAYWIVVWGMGIYADGANLNVSPGALHTLGLIAGAAAFIGHCYPVWLKFKGGKGVATYIGLLLASMFPVGAGFGAIWLLTAFVFRMSSLAALVATAATPFLAYWLNPGGAGWIITGALAVLIYWRHRANIARILSGTEPKIGQKRKDEAPAETGDPPVALP
ncbi:MAG TPA: glycerol-3-phosphate 1-O-acyltransferase PlsY [Hyphomonadaceae bacterium]|nr:glycerol-3-phosphate 1-O-acyltransferase PlsY [Hyphomonadaceae bacterium]